jgi:hypothetical protein
LQQLCSLLLVATPDRPTRLSSSYLVAELGIFFAERIVQRHHTGHHFRAVLGEAMRL